MREALTVRAALRRAQAVLDNEQAAKRLLADCLEQTWGWVSLHHDNALDAHQHTRLNNWLARAQAGEPLAYVTGRMGFWTLDLQVTPDVLIPRPATETLVDQALILGGNSPQQVLDLGTGSGAIALALASERPQWQLVGTDTNPAALNIAKSNAQACEITNAQFVQGDWFGAVHDQRFNGIVCNPPYIDPADPAVADSVRGYEPHAALFSADAGLADLRHVITGAPAHLTAGGWLAVEHGYKQAGQAGPVGTLFADAGFAEVSTHKDLEGHPRVTTGRLPANHV